MQMLDILCVRCVPPPSLWKYHDCSCSIWQLLEDLQTSTLQFPHHQILQRLHLAKSSPVPGSPVLPLGPSIPVIHVLSVRLQALLSPVQLSAHPTPLFVTPHPSWRSPCVSLCYLSPQRALQFYTVHSVLSPGFLFSTWLIWVSLQMSSCCTSVLPARSDFHQI